MSRTATATWRCRAEGDLMVGALIVLPGVGWIVRRSNASKTPRS
jgi:hypothetical protein